MGGSVYYLEVPILNELGLSSYPNEALHLTVEISSHKQVAIIRKTFDFTLWS